MELDKNQVREVIAKRVALELKDGDVVKDVYKRQTYISLRVSSLRAMAS